MKVYIVVVESYTVGHNGPMTVWLSKELAEKSAKESQRSEPEYGDHYTVEEFEVFESEEHARKSIEEENVAFAN